MLAIFMGDIQCFMNHDEEWVEWVILNDGWLMVDGLMVEEPWYFIVNG